jgi:putative membrane protein
MGPWQDGFGWMIFHGVFWLAVLVGVIALIIALARRGGSERRVSGPRSSEALNILEERYARGEIQRQEYLQKRRDLENASSVSG